jgi:phage tail-like protein
MRRTLVGLGVAILSSATVFAAPVNNTPVSVAAVQLTVNGATVQFRQCSEIGSETEIVELQDAKSPNQITKIPGKTTVPTIVCSRSFANDQTLAAWRTAVENGNTATSFKSGSLVFLDDQLSPIVTFNFIHGWPNYLKLNAVDATSPSPLTETISIVVDDINRQ